MSEMEQFGANVRVRREQLGISQEQLAERAGVHRTYVGSVERGERNLSLLNILRIAAALECGAADLLKGIAIKSRRGG
jgi:transcriptional regulator with XRE-family HTH domain